MLSEEQVLEFWDKKKVYKKVKNSLKNKKQFTFLDGPPYANGKIHLGHAWNRTFKDIVLRYKRMNGFNVNDRPGFDTHGLPIEKATEKKLGIKNKREIEEYGAEKFISECKKLAKENIKSMTEDFKRLGVWMDWENPYYTFSDEYIDGVWWMVKNVYDKKLLYKDLKVIEWCPVCGTALAKSNIFYKEIEENSIFVKMRSKEDPNTYYIVWTTTPWTIPLNEAIMVNPDLTYVKAKVGDEYYIIAEGLVGAVMGLVGKSFEIVEKFTGKELEGKEYIFPLLEEVPKQTEFKNAHRIVLSKEYVSLDAGTGLVHCAPGCGPEDFTVGKKEKLPIFSPISADGRYEIDAGKYTGMYTKSEETENLIISDLKKHNALLMENPVKHDYPFCERCKSPIIFRATEQWFLKVKKYKEEMLKENEKVKWIPSTTKVWFKNWLQNIEDWCISRQRYWGTPLPIWTCECGNVKVFGSINELKKATKKRIEPHKPEIDKIKVKCEKCGKLMTRIPDVLDVWIDSGVAPWATNKQYKLPYDIIIEGKDQIRGWFYSLMALSVITHGKRAYNTVYMHGFTLDEKGRGMSKSLGNGIPPEEIINKYSADTLRMYYIMNESPGEDIKFVDKEIRNAHRLLTIIKNAVKFIAENMEIENYKHKKPKPRRPEDKWIMSRINNVADKMTNYMENYLLSKAGREIINFLVEDLSRFYMKLIKDRLYIGDKNEKQEVLSILDYVIKKALVLMSPFLPITSESSYQLLKKCIGEKKLSVHMLDWVKPEEIDTELEENMTVARKLIQDILSLREKTDYNLRWPMPQVMIITTNKHIKSAVSELADIVAEQTNVKSVVLSEEEPDFVTKEVKLDYKIAGKKFGEKFPIVARKIIEISPESIIREIEKGEIRINEEGNEFVINKSDIIIESKAPKGWLSLSTKDYTLLLNTELNDNLLNEGYAREIVRRIQDLRKEKGLRKDEHITVGIQSDVNTVVRKFKSMIEKRTNSEIIIANVKDMKEYKIRDKIVKVGVVDGKH